MRRFVNRLPRSIREFFRRVRIERAQEQARPSELEPVLRQALRNARDEEQMSQ